MGFLGWLLGEKKEERETIARISVKYERLRVENETLLLENEKLWSHRMRNGRVEVAGRAYWPGTTGYQTVKAHDDLVFQSLLDASMQDGTFKGMFVNDQGQPELVTEENAHLYGVIAIDFKEPPNIESAPDFKTNFPPLTKEQAQSLARDIYRKAGLLKGDKVKTDFGQINPRQRKAWNTALFRSRLMLPKFLKAMDDDLCFEVVGQEFYGRSFWPARTPYQMVAF